jgi:serine/threonine protein kinase
MNWNEKMNTCNFKSTFQSKKKCFCGTQEHQVTLTLPSNTLCDGPDDDYIDFYGLEEISKKNKREYETLPISVSRIIVESAEKELRDLRLNADGSKLAKFSYEELEIGPLLGSGGFSSVYEIVNINPKKSGESNLCIEESNLRQAMIEYFFDNCSLLRSPLAIKMLRKKHVDNPNKFANGAIDLTLEAAYLSSLDHPNILKLRGISKEGIEGYNGGRHDSYFLIIDRLTETLQDRIIAWRKIHDFNRKWTRKGIFFKKCTKANSSMLERLKVATSVASALTYLHSRRLIYRDLKPTNIGFDINGQVQIFDFGLCCELPAEATQDLHRLPGGIGTHG